MLEVLSALFNILSFRLDNLRTQDEHDGNRRLPSYSMPASQPWFRNAASKQQNVYASACIPKAQGTSAEDIELGKHQVLKPW